MKWRLTVGGRGAEAEEDDTCQNQEETIERAFLRKNGESNEPFLIKTILTERRSSCLFPSSIDFVSPAQRLPRSKSHSITHKSHSSLQAQENEKKPRVKRPRGRVSRSHWFSHLHLHLSVATGPPTGRPHAPWRIIIQLPSPPLIMRM